MLLFKLREKVVRLLRFFFRSLLGHFLRFTLKLFGGHFFLVELHGSLLAGIVLGSVKVG